MSNETPTIPTVNQLVGMSQSHRKRLARARPTQDRPLFYIGRSLGLCPGCCICQRIKLHAKHAQMLGVTPEMLTKAWLCNGRIMTHALRSQPLIPERYHRGIHCSGSGVIDKFLYRRHCLDGHNPNATVTIALQPHRAWPIGLPTMKPLQFLPDGRAVFTVLLSQWNRLFYDAVFERVALKEPAR